MAKFKKFDPREHIHGLAKAAEKLLREETLQKTRKEVTQMLRPEQLKLDLNIVPGSRVVQ